MDEIVKKKWTNSKDKLIKIIGFAVFIIIVGRLFLSLTYLFRGNQYNYSDRISVAGLKEEKENSLDVIYIGGSAAYAYWEPLKAYRDNGFTSYDLATNTIQAENILAYVKYAQKYQNPNLYIIGVRAFQYYSEEGSEMGLRVTSDALDVGINRTKLIGEYMENHTMNTDKFALYWDIVKYHTNYDALKTATAWKLMDNSYKCDSKGCIIGTDWCYLEEPKGFQSEARASLLDTNKQTLIELLEYCQSNDLNVLFIVCPYYITADDYSIYNSVGDIVSSYGYRFLNTNDYYDEIKVDFSKDFYNINHMNSLGAEKYTAFLEKFLVENYSLQDHRGDQEFEGWQTLADAFVDISEDSKRGVLNQVAYADEAIVIGETIRTTNDFALWGSLVSDERYTICVVGDATGFEKLSFANKKMLNQLGLVDIYGRNNYINIMTGETSIDSNADGRSTIKVNIGQIQQTVPCLIENTDNECSVVINSTEYSCRNEKGINIVVFDNYYRTIIDSVSLMRVGENIELSR